MAIGLPSPRSVFATGIEGAKVCKSKLRSIGPQMGKVASGRSWKAADFVVQQSQPTPYLAPMRNAHRAFGRIMENREGLA